MKSLLYARRTVCLIIRYYNNKVWNDCLILCLCGLATQLNTFKFLIKLIFLHAIMTHGKYFYNAESSMRYFKTLIINLVGVLSIVKSNHLFKINLFHTNYSSIY